MIWTVKSNPPLSSDFSIEGNTLVEAIESSFERITRVFRLRNAAGYRLEEVTATFRPSILGGSGGVELRIVHRGLELAHRPADNQSKTYTVWIYAKHDDLPTPYTFEIA